MLPFWVSSGAHNDPIFSLLYGWHPNYRTTDEPSRVEATSRIFEISIGTFAQTFRVLMVALLLKNDD
jgi:hypothetical protein